MATARVTLSLTFDEDQLRKVMSSYDYDEDASVAELVETTVEEIFIHTSINGLARTPGTQMEARDVLAEITS